tara:strand:- start:2973 stop:3254 length:282 start_codon:yes stop_codon:yes gene_type:complete
MPNKSKGFVDFKLVFESSPGLLLLIKPNFEIMDATNEYLQETLTKREEIVGKNLFVVFLNNSDDAAATGTANIRASLNRVLSTKKADTMDVQK